MRTPKWRKLAAAAAFCALPAFANVLDPNMVDFVVVERTSPEVFLDIVQHLPWNGQTFDLLDRKVDAYVRFVYRGELLRKYPDMAGKPIVVRVVYVDALDPSVRWRLEAIKTRIAPRGIGLTWVQLTAPPKTSSAQ